MSRRVLGQTLIAGAQVQRCTEELPVLHLEPQIPSNHAGELVVDGLVQDVLSWSYQEIQAMCPETRVWDLNCVWGWTRRACRWEGIPAGRLIDAARPLAKASYVVASAAGDHYQSCLSVWRARRSLLAWRLDGRDLTPEHGWPLRLVPPPTKWAYKGVKWVTRLTLVEEFAPGFWEGLVGDVHGDIPNHILDHLNDRGGSTDPCARALDDRLTLEEVIDRRGIPPRDCRQCPKFVPDPEGRGFGWCQAFSQYVKLYHPAGGWHSQCQFKNIRLTRDVPPRVPVPALEEGDRDWL